MNEKTKTRMFEMFGGLVIKITDVPKHISPEEKYFVEYIKSGEILTSDWIYYKDKEADILDKFNKSFVILLDNDLITMFDYSSITMNGIIMWLLSN